MQYRVGGVHPTGLTVARGVRRCPQCVTSAYKVTVTCLLKSALLLSTRLFYSKLCPAECVTSIYKVTVACVHVEELFFGQKIMV
jgi:hypothetical protein